MTKSADEAKASRPDPSQKCSVRVIDDDDSFRRSLIRMLQAAGLVAIGYRCAREFLQEDIWENPGCILLDISLPGPSGVDLFKALRCRLSSPPVIFVTARNDIPTTVEVMKWGALDYLLKPVSAGRLLSVVRAANLLDLSRREARVEFLELQRRFESLTAVERVVFFGALRNRLTKQLASELGVCERTIKTQRAVMMAKLRVRSVPELVRVGRTLDAFAVEFPDPRGHGAQSLSSVLAIGGTSNDPSAANRSTAST